MNRDPLTGPIVNMTANTTACVLLLSVSLPAHDWFLARPIYRTPSRYLQHSMVSMTANAEVAQTPDPPGLYTNYASKSFFVLAGIQITIGVSTSLLTIAVFAGFLTEIIVSLLCGAIVSSQCSVQLYNMRHCKCTVKSMPLRNSKQGMMSDKWIVI